MLPQEPSCKERQGLLALSQNVGEYLLNVLHAHLVVAVLLLDLSLVESQLDEICQLVLLTEQVPQKNGVRRLEGPNQELTSLQVSELVKCLLVVQEQSLVLLELSNVSDHLLEESLLILFTLLRFRI